MIYNQIHWEDIPVKIQTSIFQSKKGVKEIHAIVELSDAKLHADAQFNYMDQAIERLSELSELQACTLAWKRYFISDAINQAPSIKSYANEVISIVQQPPLNGTKLTTWLYFVENVSLAEEPNGGYQMKRPDYTHLFHPQQHDRQGNVEDQTHAIFERYTQSLTKNNCTLEANCIRTWIYVQDVDVQYMGMVNARKIHFEKAGLTSETHFIASTGIEGRYIYPEVLVLMDAYAIQGLQQEQIRYLYAPTHLNPTYEYGVTFERGTAVEYGDRRQIFISGTASINNRGEIVHPLNIEKQTERTLENVSVLLHEAGATMDDVAHLIVYLRDMADYQIVSKSLEKKYPLLPKIIVLAPVCRPGWLIEIECIAIIPNENHSYQPF